MPHKVDRTFSVAPMLDWTDRHMRYFLRLISKRALLYTEMVTTGAIIHGDSDRFLRYNQQEHPVALQLGGSVPNDLVHCAKIAEDYGYDEINLNIGCPSDRVQSGMFGACLMAKPELVAEGVAAMKAAVNIPVTVKSRIGIDDLDSYADLVNFIATVAERGGCKTFIIHARKAWLQGLSPKENREIPPLHYETVYRIKQDFPDLEIIVNGGITTLTQCHEHLTQVDGVMIGREAYHNPFILAAVDQALYGDKVAPVSKIEVYNQYLDYVKERMTEGAKLNSLSRHLLGLFNGVPGARGFRRHISENAHKPNASIAVLRDALAFIKSDDLI